MRFLAAALAVLLSLASVGGSADYKKPHDWAYCIAQSTLATGETDCSATAIGPHALLTATHCEEPDDTVAIVSDLTGDGDKYQITKRLRDGNDHTILIVTATFKTWATISSTAPDSGDDVFYYGNPGHLIDVLKRGYIQSVVPASDGGLFSAGHPMIIAFSMNAIPGDSGAGVMNSQDEIVTVVTGNHPDKVDEQTTVMYSYGYALSFTKDQLAEAKK